MNDEMTATAMPTTVTTSTTDPWATPFAGSTKPSVDDCFTDLSENVLSILNNLMEHEKMTRSEIAKQINTSVANVTQSMRPGANLTLKTLNRLLYALGYTLEVKAVKL